MLYIVGPKGQGCVGPKDGTLLNRNDFIMAVENMAERALNLVVSHNKVRPTESIEIIRWCLVSGGVYRHPQVSKLEVAYHTLVGMRRSEACNTLTIDFTYDEDVFKTAYKKLESE
jgi:hypothetical protein